MKTEILIKNALIETLNLPKNYIIPSSSHLKNDLQLDSMSSIMFLMRLEETIEGFYVDPETLEMNDLETVCSIVRYVDLQRQAKSHDVH